MTPPEADLAGFLAFGRALVERAGRIPRSRVHHEAICVAGLECDLFFSDPATARLFLRRIASSGTPAGAIINRVNLHVLDERTIEGSTFAGLTPPSAAQNRTILTPDFCLNYDHELHLWEAYDPARRIGVRLAAAPDACHPWEAGAPLRVFFHWALSQAGRRLVHAATLGAGGKGVLIAGPGGAGKSGTTLAGIAHGLATVGDDYVVVDPAGPVALPLYRLVKQDPAGLRRMPALASLAELPANWQGKVEIEADLLPTGAFAERLALRAILIPEIAHGARTQLAPAGPAQAMRALSPSGIIQVPGYQKQGFRFFANLVRHCPAYTMRLSEDPCEIARTIGDFLQAGA